MTMVNAWHNWGPRRLSTLVILAALLCMGASKPGCASASKTSIDQTDPGGMTVDDHLRQAQVQLAKHDVAKAQYIYDQIVAEQQEPPGEAIAGKAICDLLMLPGSDQMTRIFVEQLGATSGIDPNDAIYAEQGYLYWLARGVPWSDQGQYSGIRTLIADDLPWPSDRLSSLQSFFTGLDSSTNETMDDLVRVADAMGQIQNELDRAAGDPSFQYIYIPGQTFHYDKLDLVLGPSELHVLSSLVAASRGAIYFMAAYDHDYTLDELLGAQAQARQTPHDGWGTVDYAMGFLDGHLGRKVRDASRLTDARDAFDHSLTAAIDAVQPYTQQEPGLAYEGATTLQWRQINPDYAQQLVDFLGAVRQSMYGRTPLPGTTPKTSLDLSPLFTEGRTLDPSLHWFEAADAPATLGPSDAPTGPQWHLTDAAVQAFFVDGLFEPSFDVANGGPTVAIGGDRGSKFHETVSGQFESNVEDAYFTTR